jgi:hypothetical protein
VATLYQFAPGDNRTAQLRKSITNKNIAKWAENIETISLRHGPQMLTFMSKLYDSEAALTRQNTDREKQRREQKHAYRIRKGLAEVLIACSPAQREQLFASVADKARYDAVVFELQKTAKTDVKPHQGTTAYRQLVAGIRFGINRLLEAPYELPEPLPSEAPTPTPASAIPPLSSLGQWMVAQASLPPPAP